MKKQVVHRKRCKMWRLQKAKARFSELVNAVMEDGYHTITKNGRPFLIVIAYQEFKKLKAAKKTLGEFLVESPFSMFDLDIQRDKRI